MKINFKPLLVSLLATAGTCVNAQVSPPSDTHRDSTKSSDLRAQSTAAGSGVGGRALGALSPDDVRLLAQAYQSRLARDKSKYAFRQLTFNVPRFQSYYATTSEIKFIATTTPTQADRPASTEASMVIKSKINADSFYYPVNERFPENLDGMGGRLSVCNSTKCPDLPVSNNPVTLSEKEVKEMRKNYLTMVENDVDNAILQITVDGIALNKEIKGKKSFSLIPVWKKGEEAPFIVLRVELLNGKSNYFERKNIFSVCPPPVGCDLHLLGNEFQKAIK